MQDIDDGGNGFAGAAARDAPPEGRGGARQEG